jgi:hypothetical protein
VKESTIIRFLKKNGINTFCCSSCHEDEENGYDYLIEMYFTKNRMATVCCAVSTAFDKLLKIKPQYNNLVEK